MVDDWCQHQRLSVLSVVDFDARVCEGGARVRDWGIGGWGRGWGWGRGREGLAFGCDV